MKWMKNSLMQYSAFATSYIIMHENANAQVIYTDINPDVTLIDFDADYNGAIFGIDFDGDSLDDIIFINTVKSFEKEDGTEAIKELLFVGVFDNFNNGIAGYRLHTSSFYFGTRYYPYALALGDTISSRKHFYNANYQRMAGNSKFLYSDITFNGGFGYWDPFVVNKYLGIKFIDQDNQRHYGWIRCDVNEHMHRIVIKDYAYEQQPDHPIIAGSVESFVVANAPQINTLQASIYSFGNTIYIKTANLNAQQITVKITDITGKQMYAEQDVFTTKQITLNVPHGIYFVSVIIGEEITVAKVYL